MPELPEVETIRRSLEGKLPGRRILGVIVRDGRLRVKVDSSGLRGAGEKTIERLSRRSKYLLIHLEGGQCLVFHLGMSGRLLLLPDSTPLHKHDHVIFLIDQNLHLRFRDPRRFGLVDLIAEKEIPRHKHFQHLGVEPLSAAFNARYVYEHSRHLKKPVKNFLMDGNVIVGVGNIYANEALFLAGIKPMRPAGKLNLAACERLARFVKKVLQTAIRKGGTTISDFFNSDGGSGYFQLHLRVYDRAKEPCFKCNAPIRRKVMAGRSTFYCASCQR